MCKYFVVPVPHSVSRFKTVAVSPQGLFVPGAVEPNERGWCRVSTGVFSSTPTLCPCGGDNNNSNNKPTTSRPHTGTLGPAITFRGSANVYKTHVSFPCRFASRHALYGVLSTRHKIAAGKSVPSNVKNNSGYLCDNPSRPTRKCYSVTRMLSNTG